MLFRALLLAQYEGVIMNAGKLFECFKNIFSSSCIKEIIMGNKKNVFPNYTFSTERKTYTGEKVDF